MRIKVNQINWREGYRSIRRTLTVLSRLAGPRTWGTVLKHSTEVALAAVGLTRVMAMTEGAREIRVALIDGPVSSDHPDLAIENIHSLLSAW